MPHFTTRSSQGFTLLEMVVIISIIGILAATIYTVTTSGMKSSAKSSMETTVRAVGIQLKAAANEGRFPNTLPNTYDPDESEVELSFGLTGPDYYCVNAVHKKYDDLRYYVDSSSSDAQEGDCSMSSVDPYLPQ